MNVLSVESDVAVPPNGHFTLPNQVRLNLSQALLLLYRYLTSIYVLGDLAFVQFVDGYLSGRGQRLDGGRVLTISGNGIGELERLLCLQWSLECLHTQAVSPVQMATMRFVLEASPDEVVGFFDWTRERLSDFPHLRSLFDSPGLVNYWQQQCRLWQSVTFENRVQLFGGTPWDIPETECYDAILMSHAQRLFCTRDAKELLRLVAPGGCLTILTPVLFRPKTLGDPVPARFADLPSVRKAKQKMAAAAKDLGYELLPDHEVTVTWSNPDRDLRNVVSFAIASPLQSLVVGELLILSLNVNMPERIRLTLLEASLNELSQVDEVGTEALLIMLTQKE